MGHKTKDIGRLRYIEPAIFNNNTGGGYDEHITHPYEDYCMAVDLTITVADRYSCGWGSQTGSTEYKYSSSNGSISFFGGTSGETGQFLTTNFTDVSMTTPGTNTSECLGIESISINYDNHLFPLVVVKFIDVRGATLMSPTEAGYYNSEDVGNSRDLYKAFFTIPYPMFILKVKGYYGNGTTFKLALHKSSIEFNSETGNFNITASFIGYMYGIYADLPMPYIAIAPYMDGGKEYWNNKIMDGTFMFRDASGYKVEPMVKLPELRYKLANAASNEEYIHQKKTHEKVINNIDEEIDLYKSIYKNFPYRIFGKNGKSENNKLTIRHNVKITRILHTTGSTNYWFQIFKTEDEVVKFKTELYEFYQLLQNIDTKLGSKVYTSTFSELSGITNPNINDDFAYYWKVNRKEGSGSNIGAISSLEQPLVGQLDVKGVDKYLNPGIGSAKVLLNGNNIKNVCMYGTEKNLFKKINEIKGQETFYICYIPVNTDSFNTIDAIEGFIKNKQEEKNGKEQEYRSSEMSLIEKLVGFRPSIRNIYELIFAHMETFMHCFYSQTKLIRDSIENNQDSRKKLYQGVNDEDTDTIRYTFDNSSSRMEDLNNFLPPYAAYYQNVYDAIGANRKEMTWIGNVVKKSDEMEEVHFINNMLGGAETYADKAIKVQGMLDNIASGNTGNKEILNTDIEGFIPVTIYDFAYKDSVDNPYSNIKDIITNGSTDNIEANILSIFALRAFYFLATTKYDSSYYDSVDTQTIGTIEAINLFKALGDNHNMKFLTFLKKYTNKTPDAAQFIPIITGKDNNISNLWGISDNKSLFKRCSHIYKKFNEEVSSIVYIYNFNKYLPIGTYDLVNIKNDYTGSNLGKDYRYIDTIIPSLQSGHVNTNTFKIYHDRGYINSIFNNVEKEINEAEKQIENDLIKYGQRKSTDYGTIFNTIHGGKKNVLNYYKNEYKSKLDDIFYKKGCIVEKDGEKVRESKMDDIIGSTQSENYFIKYPSYCFGNKEKSFFETSVYKQNKENYEVLAYFFLQSIPLNLNNFAKSGILKQHENGVALKSLLLREGAYYWYLDEGYDKVETGEYEKAKENECYIGEMETLWFYKKKSLNTQDGYNSNEHEINNTAKDHIKYRTWEYPVGCTPSRKIVLKEYFKKWATDIGDLGFKGNLKHLTNTELYINSKYSEGLNLDIESSQEIIEMNSLQYFLRDLFFGVDTIFDLYNVNKVSYNYNINEKSLWFLHCGESSFRGAFTAFIKQLTSIYGDMFEKDETIGNLSSKLKVRANNPFENNDVKLALYLSLKSLYDKWLCAPQYGPLDTWTLSNNSRKSDFNNFIYTDSFYHDIGDIFTVNLTKVANWVGSCLPTSDSVDNIMGYTGKSVYNFLTEVAQDSGAMLMAIPQRFGTQKDTTIKEMFTAKPLYSDWDTDEMSFVFMYTYKPSEHLDFSEEGNNGDLNGWKGDGIDFTNEELMGQIVNDNGYTIPAFGVTHAKQNQSYFKNIRLSSEQGLVTDVSLANTQNIASKASQSPRESYLYGQDIYRIYNNRAYTCEVETMGNVQIMPLMFFQLNNIPMWKGGYQIKKVSHEITAGNFVTKFAGVRINRNAIPIGSDLAFTLKNTGEEINEETKLIVQTPAVQPNDSKPSSISDVDITKNEGPLSKIKGVKKTNYETMIDFSKNKINTVIGNENIKDIKGSKTDYDKSNVEKNKPLICITPAHGPNTEKSLEWIWSTKVVDTLKSILLNYKYYDGTTYNVHRCNENGNNTGRYYSMKETQNLIKRHGSDKVISVVPHWNEGGGRRYEIFLHWSGYERQDSVNLANCMKHAVNNRLKDKSVFGEYKNAVNNEINILPLNYYFKKDDRQDGAPRLDCACILTENWYSDYDKNNKSGGNNRLKHGRYDNLFYNWLMSDEGIQTVAQMHADAIKEYIDTYCDS